MTLDDILENFEFLDDWEDKYKYVIELGRDMPELDDQERVDANKVQGCVSQVWLVRTLENTGGADGPVVHYRGDSDAHIVRGLVALVIATFSGHNARTILKTDIDAIFEKIGLREHLTPQRSNGLTAMINRIKTEAADALERA
ncbi:MAG: SufE family protein [Pseudomonadota bacterium]